VKNILLFFLSDIHLKKETNEFVTSEYDGKDGAVFECIQTNEPAVDYMMSCLNNRLDALFYFSTKKTKEKLAVTENGETFINTHVEWFQKRILQKYPMLASSFHSVDYDEDKDTEESIRQVTAMTEQVKQYVDESEDKDIRIYADMTGGFRHASMMMLSVMQLLNQYQGIKVEKVLYSNWQGKQKKITEISSTIAKENADMERKRGIVEEVTELHRMFTLISGTDEFINFGSVKEIDRYFANRAKSPALEALLNTMRSFSDAIKICRTNKIEDLVKQLKKRIDDFSKVADKTVHEKIFAQIISILKEEYGALLSSAVSKTDIIEWCIEKGFLQQAMTLCTEWLPVILVDRKICYTDDSAVRLRALKEGIKKDRGWKQEFIISFNVNGILKSSLQTAQKGNFSGAIQNYLKNKNTNESAAIFPPGRESLLQLFYEIDTYPDIFSNIKDGTISQDIFCEIAPMIEKACRILWKFRMEQHQTRLKYDEFLLQKINDTVHLLNQLQALPSDKYNELLDIVNEGAWIEGNSAKTTLDMEKKPRWENREIQYIKMLETGIMKTKYPDKVMEMLKGYYDIRSERNKINHAASEVDLDESNSEMKLSPEELMKAYLSALNKFK